MTRRLQLYTRRGCPLCDDMLDDVEALCHGHGVEIEPIDVDRDPELAVRYGERVPVLVADGRELCAGRLDAVGLRRLLSP